MIGHHIRNLAAERNAHFNHVASKFHGWLRGELRIKGSGRSQVVILARRDVGSGAGIKLIAIDAPWAGLVRTDQIKVASTLDGITLTLGNIGKVVAATAADLDVSGAVCEMQL